MKPTISITSENAQKNRRSARQFQIKLESTQNYKIEANTRASQQRITLRVYDTDNTADQGYIYLPTTAHFHVINDASAFTSSTSTSGAYLIPKKFSFHYY